MPITVGQDTSKTRRTLTAGGRTYAYYSIPAAEEAGLGHFSRLPAALKVVLENMLRFEDGKTVSVDDIRAFSEWAAQGGQNPREIAYRPARVLMQDFTGVPAVVDLAAMRDGIVALGRRPRQDQPAEPRRPRHRPFGDDRRIRQPPRLPDERRPRIRAQHGALRVPQMGPERLQQLPRRAPRHRHLPPGEPRIPRQDRLVRHRPERRPRRLPRHPRRHRQPHHHGQRRGRPRLGRGRDRGRGRDAGPAHLHAHPRSRGLQAHRPHEGRHDRHRPRAQGRPDAPQEGRGRTSSSNSTAPASTTCRSPTARPSATWPPNTARPAASSRSTAKRSATSRRRAATRPPLALVEAYAKANGMWRGPDYDPVYTDTLELDMSTVVPAISGPKRPQDHTPLDQAAPAFYKVVAEYRGVDMSAAAKAMAAEGDRNAPEHRRPQVRPGRGRELHAPRRLHRHRLDHLLHQHLEPLRDDRRRPRRAEGPRPGPHPQALGQDLARPRLPGRLGLSRGGGPAGGSRRHRLQPRGLRLHHLHRQLRPAPAGNLEVDQRQRPDRGLRPLGQPQLRRPHLSGRPRELPRLPAARRGLCARGRHQRRHHERTARAGQERPRRLPQGHLAHEQGNRRPRPPDGHARGVPVEIRRCLQGRREVAGASKTTDSQTYDWPATSTYVQNPPYFDGITMETHKITNLDGAKRPRHPRRHGHDRPHLPRRLLQGHHACGPLPRRTAGARRASSTPTAPAAATTR